MTAPTPQLPQMALRNVPTGHLFSFDMKSIYKLTAKAGMGPQVTLHAVPLNPDGSHGEAIPAETMAQYLDAMVSTMPDPAGNSAVAPPAPVQTIGSSNLATAAAEAAANAAVVGTFPAAAPITPPLSNTPPGLQAPAQTVGTTQATLTPAPSQGTSTSAATSDAPAFLNKRSGPLREAVTMFDGWATWPEGERWIGQRFQLAAYNLAEGTDSLATVRALLALHTARELARGYVPVMSPF